MKVITIPAQVGWPVNPPSLVPVTAPPATKGPDNWPPPQK